MKLWLTAAEIAEAGLPGMPTRRESVIRLAEREGWSQLPALCRPRAGRGGGLEYHIRCLPLPARLAWLEAHSDFDVEAAASAMQAAPDPSPGLTDAAALQRDARLALVGAYRAFRRETDLAATTAIACFADIYTAGRIATPDWVRAAAPRLSARTLSAWIATLDQGEVDRLGVDRGAARRGKGLLDAALDGAIKIKALALVAHNPHLSADHIRETLVDQFGDTIQHGEKSHAFPCVRALQVALKRWKSEHAQELLAITNPDAFKSRMRVSGSRAHLVTGLNQLWEIDASPFDALTTDGRHSIYVCIDVWSRRLVILVTKTPRAEAVGLLMRKAILAWGVPDLVKTDNGSDFTARSTRRLFAALGIETETAAPYSPEQKGVIERAIGTVQRDFAATLPGFVGHSVADRKVIEARKAFSARLGLDDARAFHVELSAADLQARADAWATDRYAHRPHGGLAGQTPYARANSWTQPVRRIADEAALSVLLAPALGGDGTRIVGKQGLRIDGAHYIAAGLTPGRRVLVRLDPADLGRVWCFEPDGETFLSAAICPELAGVDRAAAVAEARAAQKRLIAEAAAPIRKEASRIRPADVADALARRAAVTAGKLVELPRPAETHTTPALEAAGELRFQAKGPVAQPLPERDQALAREIEREIAEGRPAAPANVRSLRQGPTPQQLFRRALDIRARLEAGDEVSADDARWLGGYEQTAGFRAMDKLFREFGEVALR